MFRAALEEAHPGRQAEYGPLLDPFEKNPEAMVAALTERVRF